MAWDTKFERFGVIKIEGNIVKVYKDQFTYITVSVNKQVTNAVWVDGALNIRTIDGKVKRYINPFVFTTF